MAQGMKRYTSGGGFPAIWYTLMKSNGVSAGVSVRDLLRMWRALNSRNACKTCALGMGGQLGGMVNEAGHFPEVCKKSVQAMAADLQGGIRDGFFDEFGFDKLERFTPRELEMAGRLTQPMYAGPGDKGYRAISWEEALFRGAEGLKRAKSPDETFFYFSGRSSNEAGFLLQLFARLTGTNNVNNCSYFCHQASGVGLASVTGSGTATVTLDDVAECDLFFLIGGNPASNHPRLMRSLLELKRNGGKVVVINPLRELGLVNFKVPSDPLSLLFGTKIADEYVMPHIGGDIALLMGIAKGVLEAGGLDEAYVKEYCEGFEEFVTGVRASTWSELERSSGVLEEEMRKLAGMYMRSERTIFAWTMGITHHEHGVDNVRAIANLAMMRGMLGRPGRGLLPLRGHSNVQGIGSMGAVPELKGSVVKAIEERLQVTLPRSAGLDTLGCVEKAAQGGVRWALHLGGNLYGSCPDCVFAKRALAQIDMTIFMSTTLNTGHAHGRGKESLILPVLARDEDPQATTQESMFNFVRLSEGGERRHEGPRAEVAVIAALARLTLGEDHPANFKAMEEHKTIRAFIADVIPGYKDLASIDATKREFHVGGRVFHTPRFATASGKAKFHAVQVPGLKGANGTGDGSGHEVEVGSALRLMTIRSEGQFNTVVYEEEDVYRHQERRDVILMNELDIQRLKLKVDERVTVRSQTGEMRGILVRSAEIRAGNAAMYYPESNVLVSRSRDNESKTPSFKNTIIWVEKARSLYVLGRVLEEVK